MEAALPADMESLLDSLRADAEAALLGEDADMVGRAAMSSG